MDFTILVESISNNEIIQFLKCHNLDIKMPTNRRTLIDMLNEVPERESDFDDHTIKYIERNSPYLNISKTDSFSLHEWYALVINWINDTDNLV